MSIWSKDIFGCRHQDTARTPATNAAKCCERIRTCSSNLYVHFTLFGLPLGFTLFLFVVPLALVSRPQLSSSILTDLTQIGKAIFPRALYIVAFLAAFAWGYSMVWRRLEERHLAKCTMEQLAAQRRARHIARRVFISLGLAAGLGLLLLLIQSSRYAGLLASAVAFHAGFFMLGSGFFGRVGHRLACAGCDYPMTTWRGSPPQCPECGRAWKQPRGARIGVRRVRWRSVLLGIALLAFAAACLLAVRLFGR